MNYWYYDALLLVHAAIAPIEEVVLVVKGVLCGSV